MFKHRATRSDLIEQHRRINDALQARDAAGARAAVEAHLAYVEQSLFDQSRSARNEVVAQQRFEHEKGRT